MWIEGLLAKYVLLCVIFFFQVPHACLGLQKEGSSFHPSVEKAFLTCIWGIFFRERSGNYS